MTYGLRFRSMVQVTLLPPIGRWPAPLHRRPLATGHQAFLWHPGILAKFFAVRAVAGPRDERVLHVVVDQDAHEALQVEWPVRHGRRLMFESVRLAPHDPNVPTGCQPPSDADVIRRALRERPGGERLLDAFSDLPACRTLAEQVTAALQRLMAPLVGRWKTIYASDLGRHFDFDEMLEDARACATAYNEAIAVHPARAIAKMQVRDDRVELPVWALRWQAPRQRVFAALGGEKPAWVFADNRPVDRRHHRLAPRALLLTAIVRSELCGLFVHGTGGMAYDQVTQAWWQRWRGKPLAPIALATADLPMAFDAPVAEPADLHRAVWHRHHLPHNIDRALGRPDPRKARLFNVKDRTAFDELHRINAALVSAHPDLIDAADADVAEARLGLANAAVARKRDWCFALYESSQLQALGDAICRTIPS